MRIYLGGYLNYYHPRKENWLEIELKGPTPLLKILEDAGIPLGEVGLAVIDGEVVALQGTIVSVQEEVRLYSAVGGG